MSETFRTFASSNKAGIHTPHNDVEKQKQDNMNYKSEITKLSEEVRTIRTLLKHTQDRMVKEISTICLMNGGKIDTEDLSVESDDMPCVSYDGGGDNGYSDPYSKVKTIKAEKHKTWAGVEYEGFTISVSAELCDAVLDDYELSYSEIEDIFLFLTQDENIETLLDNQ